MLVLAVLGTHLHEGTVSQPNQLQVEQLIPFVFPLPAQCFVRCAPNAAVATSTSVRHTLQVSHFESNRATHPITRAAVILSHNHKMVDGIERVCHIADSTTSIPGTVILHI